MNEQQGLAELIGAFKRHKNKFLVCSLSLFFIVAIIALVLPPVYKSSAIILIEQQDIPSDLVRSTITSYADQRVQIISQQVMTTSNLTKIIKKYNLYPQQLKTKTREEVIDIMRDDIDLDMISAEVIDPRSGRPTQATIAFTLSYAYESADLSQRVANELVSLYLGENLKSRKKKAAEATSFLTTEADRLRVEIEKLEKSLAVFKENNAGSLPELTQLNMQILERTDRELLESDRQISALQERKIYLESELSQLNPSSVIYSDSGERILSPQGRLKSLQAQYLSAAAIYNEDHPDIIRMRRELEALRKDIGTDGVSSKEIEQQLIGKRATLVQLEENYAGDHPDIIKLKKEVEALEQRKQALLQQDAGQDSGKTVGEADNPAYLELKTRLDAVTTEITALQSNKAKLKAKIHEYENRLIQTPQVEREYMSLTRDQKQLIHKYQEISAKLNAAKLAEELERESKGERFSLIEPPLLPERPISPNRIAILIIGFMLSISIGLGCVAVFENMDDSVRGDKTIVTIFGFAPLATIPYVATDQETTAKTNKRKYACIFVVAVLLSMAILIHSFFLPLDTLWYIALRKIGI